jgi:MraZ protein
MFLGQYQLSIEDDLRLTIPTAFRELFSEGAYITRGFEQNLLVMSEKEFQVVYKKISALNITDPLARLLVRLILGNASRLEMSESGHVLIPQELMKVANLEKSVILVGQGDYCEAWAPADWDKQSIILLDTVANSIRFASLDLALT